MKKEELIKKLEEKIEKKSNKARIEIVMGDRKMIIDTITIQKDPEDGHINGNVHAEENGKAVTATLMQIISLCDNPNVTVNLIW